MEGAEKASLLGDASIPKAVPARYPPPSCRACPALTNATQHCAPPGSGALWRGSRGAVFGPRSIETSYQYLSPLVASPEGLAPEPQLRRLPVTQTSPQGQPPLAHRRARDSSRGCGEKVRLKFLLCCRCCQVPCAHFFLCHQLKAGCKGESAIPG